MDKSLFNYRKIRRTINYPLQLSDKDEYIPDTHIGLYYILTNPKNKTLKISEKHCQLIREKTYNGLNAIYREYGSPSYADLWNYNLNAINENGYNHFITISQLVPFAQCIECFEKAIIINEYNNRRLMISFAISKENLAAYAKNPNSNKKMQLKLPPKSRDQVIFGFAKIPFFGKRTTDIEINALYLKFKHWCKIKEIEESKGILIALESLLNNYPLTGLDDTDKYNTITEIDRNVFRDRKYEGKETIETELSSKLLSEAKDIIYNYNLDVENLTENDISLDTYLNNALYLMNQNMPLKYSNPKLYEEQQKIEEMKKRHNL